MDGAEDARPRGAVWNRMADCGEITVGGADQVNSGSIVRHMLRRWWIVVLIAVLAAGGAYLAERSAKDTWRGAVDITVPADQSGTQSANGQYVENLSIALTTPSVLQQISSRTSAPLVALKANLSVSQLGNSSFVEVHYTAFTQDRAKRVASAAAQATTSYLARPAERLAGALIASASKAEKTAQSEVTDAQSAIDAFQSRYGYATDPNALYQTLQNQLTQLTISRQQALSAARPTRGFDTEIAAVQKQLKQLTPRLHRYSVLTTNLNQAQANLSAAQQRMGAATTQRASAQTPVLIDPPTATLQRGRTVLIKAVGFAAGIGFVLGLALVLVMALLRRERDSELATGAQSSGRHVPTEPADGVPAAPAARVESRRRRRGGSRTPRGGTT